MAKPSITKRITKTAALTYSELDANFQNLADATLTVKAGTGGTNVTADLNGTITLVAGTNITLTGDNSAKTVTITSSGGGTGLTNPLTADLNVGSYAIISSSNGNIRIEPNGSGNIQITPATGKIILGPTDWPTTTPTSGQVLTAGTAGALNWANPSGISPLTITDASISTNQIILNADDSNYTGNAASIKTGTGNDQLVITTTSQKNRIYIPDDGSYISFQTDTRKPVIFLQGLTKHVGMSTASRDADITPVDGMIVYNSTTNKFNVRETSSWNTVVTAGPAFRANPETAQTITSGSLQKVTFGAESFDTNSNFSSSRFTPTVAGYYQLNSTVRLDGGSTGTGECMIVIYKNGSEFSRGWNSQGTQFATDWWSMSVSDIAYANGSTDYFEIYIQQGSGSNRTTTAYANISHFSGCLIRPA
jgi:hypothetical protein